MSVIKPLSSTINYIDHTSWFPTANNFPALKAFWPCKQSDISNGYLLDMINGTQLVPTGLAVPASPDGYSVYCNTAAGAGTIVGTLPTLGTKNCLLVSVGQFSTGGPTLGKVTATSTGGISLGQAQSTALFDGTNTLSNATNGAFTSSSSIYGRALSVNWSGNVTSYEMLSTASSITTKTGTATSTATPGTIAGGIATLQATWSCPSTVTNLYGIALLVFNGSLPTNIPEMLAWVTYNWTHQDKLKTFFPGWKGLS